MTLVSVVIPCYNCEKFISGAIESALAQDWDNLEIICVDNNSTDATPDILRKFESKYANISVLYEEKPGAPSARNTGLKNASGEYVQFLDADDIMSSNKISSQMLHARNHEDCDVVISEIILKSNDNEYRQKNYDDFWLGLFTTHLGLTSSNLWKRESLLSIGGWDEQKKSSQEYELMFRLARSGFTFYIDHTPLVVIQKINDSSISSKSPVDNLGRYLDLRVRILQYLETQDYFTLHDKQQFMQHLFDKVRSLSAFDMNKALYYYNNHIKGSFRPGRSESTTWEYLFFYYIFGFKTAERLKQRLRASVK